MTSQISAKVIAHSVAFDSDNEIVTFELEYPRIIHSELMTHRLFSRNAASSRAIPIKTLIDLIRSNPAKPYRFGKNQPGMQDQGSDYNEPIDVGYSPDEWWNLAAYSAIRFAEGFQMAGYSKQVANRLLEPFQRIKTVLTATEFANFWWLRLDKDADPTIKKLAEVMKEAYDASEKEVLKPGEWHTPYVLHSEGKDGEIGYYVLDESGEWPVDLSLEEALSISSSCCAQVSYRRLNATKDKALDIYGRLLSGDKVHASPFEHQATPMNKKYNRTNEWGDTLWTINNPTEVDSWEKGITHMDINKNLWSGNFKGFIQHRQLLNNHTVW